MAGAMIQAGVLAIAVALGLWSARRIRVAAIPLLLAFGIGVGDAGLGLLPSDGFLREATELGLVLMLFYTSLAANPRAFREGGRVGLPLAAYDLVINFAIAWWIGTQFGWSTEEKLVLTGILAASSTAVVLKILGDEGRITRREGNVLVSLLLIEDWVFLGFFGFLGVRYGTTEHADPWLRLVGIVGFAAYLVALRLARHALWRVQAKELLVAMLTAAGLVGAFLGTLGGLPAVGSAFTTGLVLAGDRGSQFTQREAPYLRDGASALFFAGYGALLGQTLSFSMLPLLGWSVAGVVVAELLFLPLLAHRLGLSRREGILTGALLLPRGGKSAAFARLSASESQLFALSGLLALILTPLAPFLAKATLGWRSVPWRPIPRAPDAFSRTARDLLMPHAYRQRWSWSWTERVVFAELALLSGILGLFALLLPLPWRVAPVALAAAGLVALWVLMRRLMNRTSGSPLHAHPSERRAAHDGLKHMPLLLLGPTAILLFLAVTSPWAALTYPLVLGSAILVAALLPWWRGSRRHAPSLARALPG
ncbi:MAG TPA: cation:proton antiporter [Candidatus Thermoplasmatota archaeon]|nr:cation:proton antiporter [Candidatus Thermoplasmatota archaeon]